jgi:hypothetical protein
MAHRPRTVGPKAPASRRGHGAALVTIVGSSLGRDPAGDGRRRVPRQRHGVATSAPGDGGDDRDRRASPTAAIRQVMAYPGRNAPALRRGHGAMWLRIATGRDPAGVSPGSRSTPRRRDAGASSSRKISGTEVGTPYCESRRNSRFTLDNRWQDGGRPASSRVFRILKMALSVAEKGGVLSRHEPDRCDDPPSRPIRP